MFRAPRTFHLPFGLLVLVAALGACSAPPPPRHVVQISLTPPTLTLAKGTQAHLSASAVWSDQAVEDVTTKVTWTSGAPAIAAISAGIVSGAGTGDATVTASLGSVSGTAKVTVSAATLATLAIDPPLPTLAKGTTLQLAATGTFTDGTTQDLTSQVAWNSVDSSIAAISAGGEVTGAGAGLTSVSATSGDVTASAPLAVTAAKLLSMAVDPPQATIAKGTSIAFSATGTFSDGSTQDLSSQATWSADGAGASVSNDAGTRGLVKGTAAGNFTITAAVGEISGHASLVVSAAALKGLAMDPAALALAAGTGGALRLQATWSDGTVQDVTEDADWSSDAPAIAGVSSVAGTKGSVSALMAGNAKITAKYGEQTTTANVTVTAAALVSLAIDPPSATIALGTTTTLAATGTFTDGTTQRLTSAVTWSSDDDAVAAVSNAAGADGLVTAMAEGDVTITATLGAVKASAAVHVSAATLKSLTIAPAAIALPAGTTAQLAATGIYSDGTHQDVTADVTWASSADAIASVSNDADTLGLVSALAEGTATITASLGAVQATAAVAVSSAKLVSLAISPTDPQLANGSAIDLVATGVFSDGASHNLTSAASWTSSDATIVSISNADGTSGRAQALSTGLATITASFAGMQTSVTVTVTDAVLVSLAITPGAPVLAKGTALALAATGTYSDGTARAVTSGLSWSSSDSTIAAIGSDGALSGLQSGSATITVTAGTVHASAPVTVSPAVATSLALSPATLSLAKGTMRAFTATAAFSDGTHQNVTSLATWTSSAPAVLALSNADGSNGLATALGAGSATVTAKFAAVQASATATVTAATLTTIAIDPPSPSLPAGTTLALKATGTFSDATTQDLTASVTWTTDDASVATVSAAGVVTAVASGSTAIHAVRSGVTTSATLTVSRAVATKLAIESPSGSTPKGLTAALAAIATYSDGTTRDVTTAAAWSSADATVFTVSNASGSAGVATATGAGTTTISAQFEGLRASASLVASVAVLSSLALTPSTMVIAAGATKSFTATGTFSDGTKQDLTKTVTWTSSDSTIASISGASGSEGKVTALAAGSVVATAKLGAIQATANVVVTAATLVSLDVTPGTVSLSAGTAVALTATGTYSDGTTADLTSAASWSSSDTSVATMSNAAGTRGALTGVAAGSATIHATVGGVTGSLAITVSAAALTQIVVTPSAPSIAKGTTKQLVATGLYSDGSKQDITALVSWSSDDALVATVLNAAGQQGTLRGTAAGSTTVHAKLSGIDGSASVTVRPAELVSIDVTAASKTVPLGTQLQLTATGVFSDGSHQDLTKAVTWSSDANVSVSNASGSEGLLTTVAMGSASVVATSGAITGSASFTVSSAVLQSIAILVPPGAFAKGTTLSITASGAFSDGTTKDVTSAVTWSSRDPSVATISNASGSAGVASAKSVGTTSISAASGGIVASVSITVSPAALVRIDLSPGSLSMPKGTQALVTAAGVYSDSTTQDLTTQVTWSTADTSVAGVSNASGSQGSVSALSEGSTTLRAQFGGITATAPITVSPATLVKINVSAPSSTVAAGATLQFTSLGIYSDGSTRTDTNEVTWNSSSTGVLSISNASGNNGLATGIAAGTASVTAQLGGVTSDPFAVSVSALTVTSVDVTLASASIAKGTSTTVTATAHYSDGTSADVSTQASWASSATANATVSVGASTVTVTGASVGTAQIQAIVSGVSGTATVTVTAAVVSSIAISPASPSVAIGTIKALAATATYTDGTTQDLTATVTWTSATTSVATVSNTSGTRGQVTGIAVGTSDITATYSGVTSAAAHLTVTNPCRTVVVNEVMTGISGTTGAEFVELYNKCSVDVDLSGWRVVYHSASGTTDTGVVTFAAGTSITAGGYFLIAAVPYTTLFPSVVANATWGSSGSTGTFAAAGGGVGLKDAGTNLIDSVGYGTATTANLFVEGSVASAPTDATNPGKTIIRNPDGTDTNVNSSDFKVTTKPTPGAANVLQ